MRRFRSALAFSVLAFGLGAFGCAEETESQQIESHVRLSGAIFTTTSDGSTVNGNNYDDVCDVYLNGGPDRDGSAGLPAGDYYFQVTDPSGRMLLSSDAVDVRMVTVDASGRFVSATDHRTSMNVVDGGVAVQLCPMAETPNPGCVYKVWLTPVDDYDPMARNGNFGFIESSSKTDNFRVCDEDEPEPTPPDAGVPEPTPPDAGVPEPTPPDAGVPEDEHDCPDGGTLPY